MSVVLAAAPGMAACGGSSGARAGGGFTSREVAARRCLSREGVLPLGAAFRAQRKHTLAWDIRHQRSAPEALRSCGVGGRRGPSFIEVVLPHRELVRYVDAWTGCLARHEVRAPAPNTSGHGPIFPPGTEQDAGYRAAARHCVEIERQELNALRTAGRL